MNNVVPLRKGKSSSFCDYIPYVCVCSSSLVRSSLTTKRLHLETNDYLPIKEMTTKTPVTSATSTFLMGRRTFSTVSSFPVMFINSLPPIFLRLHVFILICVFLLDPLSLVVTVSSIGPSCRCVHFTETYGKEYGVFTSPNWPAPYEESIECLLYTFHSGLDQLVEVTFDEFDLQKTNLE